MWHICVIPLRFLGYPNTVTFFNINLWFVNYNNKKVSPEAALALLESIISKINDLFWGGPMLVLLSAFHLYFTVHTHFVQKDLKTGLRSSVGLSGSVNSQKTTGFMALSTTLAATLGTGNIIGVSSAICLGGPGALFWCFLTGVFGMATSYAECFLSVRHRIRNADGTYTGGPMVVLERALHFKILAKIYAAAVIFAAVAMSCSTQSRAFADAAVSLGLPRIPVGIALALAVGLVIVGGATRIHRFCTRLVPVMGGIFLFCCLFILFRNIVFLPAAIRLMLRSAFSLRAVTAGTLSGSLANALRYGITRGLFTNEAGLGTSAIAAADADTASPRTQALISMTATFWDTIVLCAVTGLCILTTALAAPETLSAFSMNDLTSAAFLRLSPGGPALLSLCLMAFAFATLTGWSYFGEKATLYLVGTRGLYLYKTCYIVMIFLGTILSAGFLWELTDFANLFLAIPNLLALFLLRKEVS